MSKRNGFFLLTGLTELLFAIFALTKPRGYESYGFVTSVFFDFQTFLIVMAFLSLLSITLIVRKKTYRLMTVISCFLSAQWLLIIVAPFFIDFYTMAFPLIIYFFVIRVLTTVAIEESVRNKSSLWS